MNPVKLFIGSPAYAGLYHKPYVRFMLEFVPALMKHHIPFAWPEQPDSCYVQRNRDEIAAHFMATDYTHLMFVDADMGFDVGDVMRMLAFAAHDEFRVIGAGYPTRELDWKRVIETVLENPNITPERLALQAQRWTMQFLDCDKPTDFDIDLNTPEQVHDLGTGCLLIQREALADVYREHGVYFDTMWDKSSKPRVLIGEDYLFCRQYRALGGSVWFAPWVRSIHSGSYYFRGDMSVMAGVPEEVLKETVNG